MKGNFIKWKRNWKTNRAFCSIFADALLANALIRKYEECSVLGEAGFFKLDIKEQKDSVEVAAEVVAVNEIV